MELISVVMSVFHEPEWMIRESIDSILNQTHSTLECIIVLDDPTNALAKNLLDEYAHRDARVVVLENKKNLGLALSLNKGLEVVKGAYLARMDADDISAPDRLEKELAYLKEHDLDVVCSERMDIDENGNDIKYTYAYSSSPEFFKEALPFHCIVNHPSVLMKSEALRSMGGYRDFPAAQDYDLWLRMISHGYRIGCLKEPLVRYRVWNSATSQRKALVQFESTRYVRKLHRERMKGSGSDSYSPEAYHAYLIREKAYSPKRQDVYFRVMKRVSKALEKRREGNYLQTLGYLLLTLEGFSWVWHFLHMRMCEMRVERAYAGSR